MKTIYKIEITITRTEEIIAGGRWEQDAGDRDSDGNSRYGSSPQFIKKEDVDRTILSMQVEGLSLQPVITSVMKNSQQLSELEI